MNKIKDNYARNGVRIALNSKIILLCALAFLCLAIVSLGVFNNLNALATNNIAFADEEEPEEPIRIVTSTGFYEDNLIPNNYADGWIFNITLNGNGDSATLFNEGGWLISVSGAGSIVNNYFTATTENLVIRFYINDLSYIPNYTASHTFGFGYDSSITLNVNYRFAGNVTTNTAASTTSYWAANVGSISSPVNTSRNYFNLTLPAGNSFYLNWLYFAQTTAFRGYVSPDYKYYGYNQGYQDGLNAGGGSGGSSEPEFPISSGVVQDNLMFNADCVMWQYNLVGSTAPGTVFSSNDDWNYSIIGSGGQLAYNTFGCASNTSAELCFSKLSALTPGDYVFTVGSTSISSTYDIEVLYGGSRLASETSISTTGFTSVTFTIPDNNSRIRSSDYLNLYIMLSADSSVELRFLKLETGSYFSGFVPQYYGITDYEAYETGWQYGYTRGRTVGYDAGFQDGMDAMDTSWDALYELLAHIDIVLDLLPSWFEESVSGAIVQPVGSSSIIFEYQGTVYEHGNILYNCSPTGASITIKAGSNQSSYTALKIASNVSGKVVVPYIANNVGYRLMVVNQGIPTFRSLSGYNYVVGNIPCVEVDVGNYADIYICANTYGVDLSIDAGNIFVDGFSAFGIYKYNSQSQQYRNGFNQGILQGRTYAESEIQEAFESGKVVGKNEAANYTFSSLIGAVIDTPITAAKGLLDFNILGTNLYGLFVGLLSLAVVLFIIRIFSRGL